MKNINKIIQHSDEKFTEIDLNCFPVWAKNYLQDGTKSLGCAESYFPSLFLAMASVCVGTSSEIEVKSGYSEMSVLFCIIVGEPSSKKSPAIKTVCAPFNKIQKENHKIFDEKLTEYLKEVKNSKKDSKTDDDDTKLKRPDLPLSFITDTTMEAMAISLSKNKLGILIKKDELSGFFSSLNCYKTGGSDVQTILELYGNELMIVNRVSKPDPLQNDDPFVSILGGIQLAPLKTLFSKETSGLKERFYFAFPDQSYESKFSRYEISEKVKNEYFENVINMYRKSEEMVSDNILNTYKYTEEAYTFWIDWHDNLPANKDWSAMIEKARARTHRFALILHILKNSDRSNNIIDLETTKDAINISVYYINSAIKVLGYFENGDEKADLERVLDWMRKKYIEKVKLKKTQNGTDGIPLKLMVTNKIKGVKNMEDALTICEILRDKGYGGLWKMSSRSVTEDLFCFNPKFR
jgi:hypothetical protein